MQKPEQQLTFKSLFLPFTTKKAIVFISTIGFLVFLNSLFNPFQGDDFTQIVNNPLVTHLANIPSFFYHSMGYSGLDTFKFLHVFYRPLTITMFTFIDSFFGSVAFPFHLIQLFLHILNTILVFLIFSHFMKKSLSFFLSLIFLVHPINSEVVIYIADMNEALFIFFGLSALLLLIKWKQLLYSYNRLILLGVLLLLSYFSKETGVLFSAMFFFYGIFYLRHSVKRIILISGITLLVYITLRYIASSFPSLGGFAYPVLQGSLIERLLTMPQIVVYYFSKFTLPIHQSFSQAWVVKQIDLLNFFLPLIIDLLIFICIITCGFFIHKKIYKLFKPYVFFTCWFCLGLAAHLQLIPLDATVADRWFYFPIIGLLGMIGIIVNIFYERIRLDVLASKTIFSIFCVVILLLSFLTIVRNSQWHSRLELYNHDVKYAAQNPVLYGNYGGLLMLNQQFDKAKPYLEKSVSMDPKIGSNINNLAIWYEHNKNYAKAKKLYLENIRLNPNLPRYLAISYGGLARIAFIQDNNPKEAKRLSEMALRLVSVDTQALEFLALSEYKLGNKTNALSISKQLQNQAPNAAGELYNIFSQDKPFVLDNIFGATIVN